MGSLLSSAADSLSSEVQSIRGAVRNLEQVQTASTYIYSDIQRILGFLGKVAEERQKIKDSSNPLCSEGWIHYGLSCYYVPSNVKTWNASKKDCEDKQAHLMVVNSEEEMDFLRRIANKQYLWIGLTDADGTWRWVDGTPYDITPKFWGKNQPDNWMNPHLGGTEDCAALIPSNYWNDGHCNEIMKYVCEKKMVL
ncbi:asialoglycoprotein receptor 2-like [Rana temporaria]|uniref:asialoglycoprotein receptor 2-like n=1 Tax=Rana temporaria TaxID=8407 RepID=UPI001AACBE88|nr:asialoglycoprotein receptor 2-like [Rana temporaria]